MKKTKTRKTKSKVLWLIIAIILAVIMLSSTIFAFIGQIMA